MFALELLLIFRHFAKITFQFYLYAQNLLVKAIRLSFKSYWLIQDDHIIVMLSFLLFIIPFFSTTIGTTTWTSSNVRNTKLIVWTASEQEPDSMTTTNSSTRWQSGTKYTFNSIDIRIFLRIGVITIGGGQQFTTQWHTLIFHTRRIFISKTTTDGTKLTSLTLQHNLIGLSCQNDVTHRGLEVMIHTFFISNGFFGLGLNVA